MSKKIKFAQTRKAGMESVEFRLQLSKEQAEENKEAIDLILQNRVPTVEPDDTLIVTYHLYIDYIGEVKKRLEAVLSLLNAGAKGSFKELKTGYCLIQDVLSKIEQIEGYNK